jgi:cation diffusion facilitator CzcD-associated flavoprotein CzcO
MVILRSHATTSRFILIHIVHSHLYSFSFEPNPDWSREFSPQAEIQRYLITVAEKWGLFRHIRFNSKVTEAWWGNEGSDWSVAVEVGGGKEAEYGTHYILNADFLISGVGQLNQPYYPDIPGFNDYSGKTMHSARWDWTYAMRGKRVGIIGSGATAAQIIPAVAKQCQSLVVFQRTPNWVVPRGDVLISSMRRTMYHYLPAARKRYRSRIMKMREAFYRAAYVPESAEKDEVQTSCLQMMERDIPENADLRAKLTPDYPPGCKRVVSSDDFFPAMNQANVFLETEPIHHMTQNGLLAGNDGVREHELDCLILATGFNTHEFLSPMKVYGTGGHSLHDIWGKGPKAFRGVSVESLPNFGLLYGPNTNLGHNSIILMIEAQSRYLNALISKVIQAKKRGLTLSLSPKSEFVEEYNSWIQGRLRKSTFADPGCRSWYKTAEGLVLNNWCGTAAEYQQLMSKVTWQHYKIDGSAKQLIQSATVEELGMVMEETFVFQTSTDFLRVGILVVLASAFFVYVVLDHGIITALIKMAPVSTGRA